jgi:hypothetical protein
MAHLDTRVSWGKIKQRVSWGKIKQVSPYLLPYLYRSYAHGRLLSAVRLLRPRACSTSVGVSSRVHGRRVIRRSPPSRNPWFPKLCLLLLVFR